MYYVIEALILIGLVTRLIRHRKSLLKDPYDILSCLSMILIGACIVVPNLAPTFNMSRFFHISLFFLAPCCVVGWTEILDSLTRRKCKPKHIALLFAIIVLVPYFAFQSGFVYEITKEDSWSLPLSKYRFTLSQFKHIGLIFEEEVAGAVG